MMRDYLVETKTNVPEGLDVTGCYPKTAFRGLNDRSENERKEKNLKKVIQNCGSLGHKIPSIKYE